MVYSPNMVHYHSAKKHGELLAFQTFFFRGTQWGAPRFDLLRISAAGSLWEWKNMENPYVCMVPYGKIGYKSMWRGHSLCTALTSRNDSIFGVSLHAYCKRPYLGFHTGCSFWFLRFLLRLPFAMGYKLDPPNCIVCQTVQPISCVSLNSQSWAISKSSLWEYAHGFSGSLFLLWSRNAKTQGKSNHRPPSPNRHALGECPKDLATPANEQRGIVLIDIDPMV